MKLTITLDGVSRTYHVEDTDIINTDWNEHIQDMLDTVESVE
jgi:hypothetical protein